MAEKHTILDRYTGWARVNHWVTAICLITLALSGFALFHPALFPLSALFGGGELTRILHPFIGVVLVLSFAGLFARFVRYNFFNRDDAVWLSKPKEILTGDDEKLPELGRYNAGQKLVFWLMTFLILVLVLSGIGLWDVYFGSYITLEQKRWAAVIHAAAAVIIVLVWIVHVYAAIWVRGTISAMTRGSVTGGWAWRHHRKWLREEVREGHAHLPGEEHPPHRKAAAE
jgi:formate dehydrogenase subunit gamma